MYCKQADMFVFFLYFGSCLLNSHSLKGILLQESEEIKEKRTKGRRGNVWHEYSFDEGNKSSIGFWVSHCCRLESKVSRDHLI